MTSFRKNPNFERELRAQPTFELGMRERAGVVRAIAFQVAPKRTGYYRRNLGVVGTSVVAKDPFSHLIEWGSSNNPPYAPLRRAVLLAGLRLAELTK